MPYIISTLHSLRLFLNCFPSISCQSWSKYFNEPSDQNITDYSEKEPIYLNNEISGIHVANCNFFSFINGSIRYNSNDLSAKMLVESSLFDTCSVLEEDGGAIFFYPCGWCVLDSVCSVRCKTEAKYLGQFCYTQINHTFDIL